jgi:hypothetical protein
MTERTDIRGPHPDARVFEVRDSAGEIIATFIADYFARPSKRSGAWMSGMRSQHKLDMPDGSNLGEKPIITNVMNFAKPAAGKKALLSLDDARTLFHEFGHALHGMLSDVTYPSLSGHLGQPRLRRTAVAALRALADSAGNPRKARPPLQDRRADPARAARQGAGRTDLQRRFRRGRIHRLRAGRHGLAHRRRESRSGDLRG